MVDPGRRFAAAQGDGDFRKRLVLEFAEEKRGPLPGGQAVQRRLKSVAQAGERLLRAD
jgi:hypothetical protein